MVSPLTENKNVKDFLFPAIKYKYARGVTFQLQFLRIMTEIARY